jgi:DNA-binding NtrC family response regulator
VTPFNGHHQPPPLTAPDPEWGEVRLVGDSAPMLRVRHQIEQAARSDAKVLVTGETGVGKEVVVRLIHQLGARRHMPFVTLNCAGVTESLLESELFGHVRGAFTGALRDKRGLLETANGGTMFLDEVGDMSLRMQAVLLRFLQSGEIQRVGASRASARVNVRLISATHRDLAREIADGRFREDFYFRLNVIHIAIPPLRDRLGDVPPLIDFLVEKLSRSRRTTPQLTPEARDLLFHYQWPGNVREMRNVLERLIVNCNGPAIAAADLPPHIRETTGASPRDGSPLPGAAGEPVKDAASRMLVQGESFWAVVAAPFEEGRLSKDDLRKIVKLGLQRTEGKHRPLASLFNVRSADFARFLNFLQENDCHLPPEGLRTPARKTARRSTASEK